MASAPHSFSSIQGERSAPRALPKFCGRTAHHPYATCRQMLALYARLGDVMPMNSTASIEQYECTAHTAFCAIICSMANLRI